MHQLALITFYPNFHLSVNFQNLDHVQQLFFCVGGLKIMRSKFNHPISISVNNELQCKSADGETSSLFATVWLSDHVVHHFSAIFIVHTYSILWIEFNFDV